MGARSDSSKVCRHCLPLPPAPLPPAPSPPRRCLTRRCLPRRCLRSVDLPVERSTCCLGVYALGSLSSCVCACWGWFQLVWAVPSILRPQCGWKDYLVHVETHGSAFSRWSVFFLLLLYMTWWLIVFWYMVFVWQSCNSCDEK